MMTVKFLFLFLSKDSDSNASPSYVVPVEWFSSRPIWLRADLLLQQKAYTSYAPSPVKSSALLTWKHTGSCYPRGCLCSIGFHWVVLLWKKAASRWSYWTGSITNIVYVSWEPQVIYFWLCSQVTLISCILVMSPLGHPVKNEQQCQGQHQQWNCAFRRVTTCFTNLKLSSSLKDRIYFLFIFLLQKIFGLLKIY